MPFIGKTPETGAFRLIDSITTSATDTYALTVLGDHYFPESARNLIVSLNGVTQAPETAYTVSGSHIVFASALTSSDVIDYILVIGDAVDIGTPSDGTVGDAQLKASLDLSGKTLTLANDQISGDVIHGGTISNFASTGIDDNADAIAITIDSNEQVGVGTISPDAVLHTAKTQASGDVPVILENSGTSGVSTASLVFAGSGGGGAEKARIKAAVYGDGYMTFHTNDDSEKMRLDASGNLGLNATPDAHYTGYSVFNVGASAVVLGNETTSDTNVTMTINNAYLNTGASAWVYKNSDEATRYTQISGQHRWDTAASGTAGGTITWDEAMRLDASGNLLVGKTSDDITVIGAQVQADGALLGTRANGQPMTLNRTGSDGDIAQFRKNGTTVGSIGVATSELYLASGNTGLYFDDVNNLIRPTNSAGALRDNIVDLGKSDSRFKNLYLSGGAYLGGTASGNYLDDYEEGNWTPSASSGFTGLTVDTSNCRYTKIGNTVHVRGEISNFSGQSGATFVVGGLPFSIATGVESTFAVMYNQLNIDTNYTQIVGYAQNNSNKFRLYEMGDSVTWSAVIGNQTSSSTFLIFSMTYETN